MSGEFPNIPWDKLTSLTEMVENLQGVKGETYAGFVAAIFSIGNVHTAYKDAMAAVIARLEDEEKQKQGAVAAHMLSEVWSTQMHVLIVSFASATLKQDPNWAGYSNEERADKLQRYVENMRKDAMMLVKQQED